MANGCGGGLGRSLGGSKCEHTHEGRWSWRRPLEHIFWVSLTQLHLWKRGDEEAGKSAWLYKCQKLALFRAGGYQAIWLPCRLSLRTNGRAKRVILGGLQPELRAGINHF